MKILGFTDAVNECDLCGKSELKGTYCLEDFNGNVYHYGVTCGANAAGMTSKELSKEAKFVDFCKEIDLMVSVAKYDHYKMVAYRKAMKKGYNKDAFFVKHGTFSNTTPWETYYEYAHLTHAVAL